MFNENTPDIPFDHVIEYGGVPPVTKTVIEPSFAEDELAFSVTHKIPMGKIVVISQLLVYPVVSLILTRGVCISYHTI